LSWVDRKIGKEQDWSADSNITNKKAIIFDNSFTYAKGQILIPKGEYTILNGLYFVGR
jgi:hypothetical protein